MTRAEQVLECLRRAKGDWVDGTELATERVGGSEGLRRLRELRKDGFVIEERKHPDPKRDIFQYRIVEFRNAGRVPAAGQVAAFFNSAPTVTSVPGHHAGTHLDRAWTEAFATGWYDQSNRMFQTVIGRSAADAVWVPSADLAQIQDKVDWIEYVEPDGSVWQISTKRLLANGEGRTIDGMRFIGAQAKHWRKFGG